MQRLKTTGEKIVPFIVRAPKSLRATLQEEVNLNRSTLNLVVNELLTKALAVRREEPKKAAPEEGEEKPAPRRFKVPEGETVTKFIVRIPASLREEIADYEQEENATLNVAVIELLEKGLWAVTEEREADKRVRA